jgi:SRSO17 transposase
VLDDTGFPEDGKDSPGVKRQYSGRWARPVTVRLVCRCTRSERGERCRWDGRCISPQDWCADEQRRRKAKIPAEVEFKTKPQPGVELVERAAGWNVPKAPVLGDHAYGENPWLRDRLDGAGCEYVLSVGPQRKVFEHGTAFALPTRKGREGRAPLRPWPDGKPEPIGKLIGRLGADATQTLTFRDGPDGEPVTSRLIFARVHAAHGWRDDPRRSGWREGAEVPPREEWLIAECPDGHEQPTDY